MTCLLRPLPPSCRESFFAMDHNRAVYTQNKAPAYCQTSELPWLPPPPSPPPPSTKHAAFSSSTLSSCQTKALPCSRPYSFPSTYFKSRVSPLPQPCPCCGTRASSSSPSSSSLSHSHCISRKSNARTQSRSDLTSATTPIPSSSHRNSRVSSTPLSSSLLCKSRVSSSLSSSSSYSNGVEQGASPASSSSSSSSSTLLPWIDVQRREAEIAGRAASTIIFAVANKVLYKMALVPLRDYPFLLALITTFGYVLVYFSILWMRYQGGIVTNEMLELPKYYFILSGALEACGVASGMAAAAVLPGPTISILLQTFLVWQLLLSMVFLKRKFSLGQIVGCLMVFLGVIIALSGSGMELSLSGGAQTSLFWPLLMMASCAFQASSTIVKEFVFCNACKNLKGGSVDIFVVNSFGSAFQAIFVVLMLPFLSRLRGIPFGQLHNYLKDGAGCLFNIGSRSTECSGAMPLVFGFIAVNLMFNISLLSLLKMSSAVVSSLCSTIAVPLTIFVFTLPLPYLGASGSLRRRFLVGTVILLSGLACYNYYRCFEAKLDNSCDAGCDSEVFHQGK